MKNIFNRLYLAWQVLTCKKYWIYYTKGEHYFGGVSKGWKESEARYIVGMIHKTVYKSQNDEADKHVQAASEIANKK